MAEGDANMGHVPYDIAVLGADFLCCVDYEDGKHEYDLCVA